MTPLEEKHHTEFLNVFCDELDTFIFEQNHIFKYKGVDHVVYSLNRICGYLNENYDTTISFSLTKDNTLRCESDNLKNEITLLPYIFAQFKRCYRCQRC